jgi:hypothetical protein
VALVYETRFDPDTRRIAVNEMLELPDGPVSHTWHMRTFRPTELTALLEGAGFAVQGLWGWCDQRPAGEGDRLAVLAQKP